MSMIKFRLLIYGIISLIPSLLLAQPTINLSSNTVPENAPRDTTIGLLSMTNPTAGATYTYSLSGADAGRFTIAVDTLRAAAVFDFETKSTYNLTLRATETGGSVYSKNVVIQVTNVNEAPSGVSLSKNYFAANSDSGTFIAKLTTTDVDAGDRHTYSLVPDFISTLFKVSNDSLFTNALYSTFTDVGGFLVNGIPIRIQTQDAGGLAYQSGLFRIYYDGQPPTDITLSSTTIPENTPPNTKFSKITITDPDDTSHNFGPTTTEGLDIPIVQVEGDSLRTSGLFDFEKVSSYRTTIRVVDGHNTFSKTFTFTITDVPEAPTDVTLSSTTVAEGQPSGTFVAVLTTTDEDRGDSHTYTLEGDDRAAFVISNDTLKTATRFDFETKNDFRFKIKTTDKTNLHYTEDIRIRVTNANEPPFRIIPPTLSLPENNPVDTLIAKLTTSDPDIVDSHLYAVEGVDRAAFRISNDSLKATLRFNFETKSSYNITLKTTDAAGASYSQAYAITIRDVAEPPTAISLSSQTIAENNSVDDVIGTLSASDPDASSMFTYTVAGADKDDFYVFNSELRASKVFNAEVKTEYNITIQVSDRTRLTYSQNFKITVTDQNEPPTDLNLSDKVIAENSPIGTLIGKLTTTDPDASDTHTYSLEGANAKYFKIAKDSLKTAEVLDFESDSTYTVKIKTTDSGGKTFSKNITITVTNTNDPPSDIALDLPSTTYENTARSTLIGKLRTVDQEAGDTHTYTLGGADASAFRISKDSLKNAVSFNFETKATYRFTITTRDSGGKSYSKNFTLNITDLPERPTDITLSKLTIAENKPSGTVVGLLNTSDEDKNEKHTYTLEGSDASHFRITNDSLKTATVFNFETKANYSFSLKTTDKDGLFYRKNFTIIVANMAEAPTNLKLSQNTVAENQSIGTLIGKLTTTDDDVGDTHTYSLQGDNAKYFEVSKDSLKTAVIFNFESRASYELIIKVTDAGNKTYTHNFTLKITNLPEPPTNVTLSRNTILESKPVGTLVGKLTTTDDDTGDNHTYILQGDNAKYFRIVKDSLRTAAVFNFETRANYPLIIKTRDSKNLEFTKAFTIQVTDVDEVLNTTLSQNTIAENQPIGSLVGKLTTISSDSKESYIYTLEGANAKYFKVVKDSFKTAAVFDFETRANYPLTIRTRNSKNLESAKDITIQITNVNEAPINIILSQNAVIENQPIGTLIAKLTATDEDAKDNHTYALEGDNAKYFRIANDSLKTATVFNFEDQAEYQILVKTTDSDNLSFSKNFRIRIEDVDEAITNLPDPTLKLDFELLAYPNPSTGIIQIKGIPSAVDAKIEIINSAGQIVKIYQKTQSTYDLSNLPRGLYIALIEINGKVKSLPFMLN